MDKQKDKKRLSKSILEMKFMKKSKEKVYQEQEEEEGKAIFASEVTEAMRMGGGRFIVEPSFVPCEDLIIGRLSYSGMNPEIERLMDLEKREKNPRPKEKAKPEADVSDAEMAERYSSLVGTMGNKFKSNKSKSGSEQPPRKKAKFLKPSDD